MRDAIETLNKGANQQPNLSMIAMALSGNIFYYKFFEINFTTLCLLFIK